MSKMLSWRFLRSLGAGLIHVLVDMFMSYVEIELNREPFDAFRL